MMLSMTSLKGLLCLMMMYRMLLLAEADRMSSLSDATAVVDRQFTYKLSEAAVNIQVVESGGERLPSWLMYDPISHTLYGVPSNKDKGTYILSANGDMFAVTVRASQQSEVAHSAHSPDETVICKPKESITQVKVALNTDVSTLKPLDKYNLIEDLSQHLSLHEYYISLRTQQKEDLFDPTSVLVSGVGDQKKISTEMGTSSVFYWVVGCGTVKSHQMDILERLESTSKDGTLSKTLGHGVSGWQVTINRPSLPGKRRLKRQAGVTATPAPSVVERTTKQITTEVIHTADVATTMKIKPLSVPPPITTPRPHVYRRPVVNTRQNTPIMLEMVSGQLFKWRAPADLFTDPDGGALTFSVLDYSNSRDVNSSPGTWLMFNSDNNVLIALPLDTALGTSKYILRVTNPKGLTAGVHLTIMVKNKNLSDITQFYLMTVSLPFTGSARHMLDLVYTLNGRLKKTLDKRMVKVETVTNADNSVVKFGITSPGTSELECPREMNGANLRLLRGLGQLQLKTYKDISSVNILAVRSLPISPCNNTAPVPNKLVGEAFNSKLSATKGELLEVMVPDNLFGDEEDINLEFMELELLTDGVELSATSWVYLDKLTNNIVGLPYDIQAPTKFQYNLVATDTGKRKGTFDIQLQVIESHDQSNRINNRFTLTFDENFSIFANDVKTQVMLYNKLEDSFNKSGNAKVKISSISNGSVVIAFSLYDPQLDVRSQAGCTNVEKYKNILFDKEGEIRRDFVDAVAPYRLHKASFVPLGQCEGIINPIEAEWKSPVAEPDKTRKPEDKIIYIIIPIVLIIVLITIVVVVVCIRRKKQNRHNVSKNNGTYIEKGVPVVFDEELQTINKSEPAETRPLMESNPTPQPQPPAYPQNGNTTETTPLNSKVDAVDRYQPPTPPVSDHDDTDR